MMRTFFSWLFPVFLGILMGIAAGVGHPYQHLDPANPADEMAATVAGAIIVLTGIGGFLVSMATRIAVKVAHRAPPRRTLWRLALGIVGGWAIGATAQGGPPVIPWALIVAVPFAATWSWGRRKDDQTVAEPVAATASSPQDA